MTNQPQQPHPIALAMEWVAKITTVGLEMVLPAVGGAWLDRRWGTTYWALIGLAVGVAVGIVHLLQMTRHKPRQRPSSTEREDSNRG